MKRNLWYKNIERNTIDIKSYIEHFILSFSNFSVSILLDVCMCSWVGFFSWYSLFSPPELIGPLLNIVCRCFFLPGFSDLLGYFPKDFHIFGSFLLVCKRKNKMLYITFNVCCICFYVFVPEISFCCFKFLFFFLM